MGIAISWKPARWSLSLYGSELRLEERNVRGQVLSEE